MTVNKNEADISTLIARYIVQNDCHWQRAIDKVLASHSARDVKATIPSGEQIATAIREYWHLFQPDKYARLLHHKRETALCAMEKLLDFSPRLIGAVLNGAITESSSADILLFANTAKDVELFLLSHDICFETYLPNDDTLAIEESLVINVRLEAVTLHIVNLNNRSLMPKAGKPDSYQTVFEAGASADIKTLKTILADYPN